MVVGLAPLRAMSAPTAAVLLAIGLGELRKVLPLGARTLALQLGGRLSRVLAAHQAGVSSCDLSRVADVLVRVDLDLLIAELAGLLPNTVGGALEFWGKSTVKGSRGCHCVIWLLEMCGRGDGVNGDGVKRLIDVEWVLRRRRSWKMYVILTVNWLTSLWKERVSCAASLNGKVSFGIVRKAGRRQNDVACQGSHVPLRKELGWRKPAVAFKSSAV